MFPIYREVIVRELATGPRAALPRIQPTWLDAEGRLVPDALCEAFLAFWRQHGDALRRSAPYHEIATQLVLMAFCTGSSTAAAPSSASTRSAADGWICGCD